MKIKSLSLSLLAGIVSLHQVNAFAVTATGGGVVSPVQSPSDPYGLAKVGPVMLAGSDASAQSFDNTILPGLDAFIKANLPDRHNNTASGVFEVDPNKIVLKTTTAVRAYFVSQSTSQDSSFGMLPTTPGNDPTTWQKEIGNPATRLVFPAVSSVDDLIVNSSSTTRTTAKPLIPGDFVNLGTFNQGTKLDFFMISQGAIENGAVYSSDEALNPDGYKMHVAGFTTKIFAAPSLNSPYLFLAFKDAANGGDKDINDMIIALDVGAATVNSLLATPEPAMPMTFAACLGLALVAVRKSKTGVAAQKC